MGEPITTELFVEDRAHEFFISALVARLARESGTEATVRIRSARGGHPRAIKEFKRHQDSIKRGDAGPTMPDLIVVAIDANCQRFQAAKSAIQEAVKQSFQDRTVIACPDPHVERWYLADIQSFSQVVGATPRMGRRKCKRDYYKAILSQAVVNGGNAPMLGGIEFAPEIVDAMDLYRATKEDRSLKSFVDEMKRHLVRLGGGGTAWK